MASQLGSQKNVIIVIAAIAILGLAAVFAFNPGMMGPSASGTVLVYGSIDAEDIQPVINAFEAKNPDVTIEYVRGRPSELYTRITTYPLFEVVVGIKMLSRHTATHQS